MTRGRPSGGFNPFLGFSETGYGFRGNHQSEDVKNYADLGGSYPPWPSVWVDNILQDLHNSSHHLNAEFNGCSIIHSKYLQVLDKLTVFVRLIILGAY